MGAITSVSSNTASKFCYYDSRGQVSQSSPRCTRTAGLSRDAPRRVPRRPPATECNLQSALAAATRSAAAHSSASRATSQNERPSIVAPRRALTLETVAARPRNASAPVPRAGANGHARRRRRSAVAHEANCAAGGNEVAEYSSTTAPRRAACTAVPDCSSRSNYGPSPGARRTAPPFGLRHGSPRAATRGHAARRRRA